MLRETKLPVQVLEQGGGAVWPGTGFCSPLGIDRGLGAVRVESLWTMEKPMQKWCVEPGEGGGQGSIGVEPGWKEEEGCL